MKTLEHAWRIKKSLVLFLFIFLLNCQSDDDQNNVQEQPSLVGSWLFDNPGTIERTIITFIDQTNFMLVDDGIADDDGQPGLERGTYTWDFETGILNTSVVTDTSGDWGISGLTNITLTVSGNTMTASSSGETFVFTKILSSSSNALQGSWLFGTAGAIESSVITFIDNSSYMIGDDGFSDDGGQPGIERGNYVWDTASNAISATASTDTNGDWGLTPNGEGTVTVNNGTLTYVSDTEGDTTIAMRIE